MTNFGNLPFEKLIAYQEARKLLEAMREAAISEKRRQRSTSRWPPGPANQSLPGGHFSTRAPCTPCSRGSSGGLESADESSMTNDGNPRNNKRRRRRFLFPKCRCQ